MCTGVHWVHQFSWRGLGGERSNNGQQKLPMSQAHSFTGVYHETKTGSQKTCNPFKATQLHNFNLAFPAMVFVTRSMRCVPVGTSHPWLTCYQQNKKLAKVQSY